MRKLIKESRGDRGNLSAGQSVRPGEGQKAQLFKKGQPLSYSQRMDLWEKVAGTAAVKKERRGMESRGTEGGEFLSYI